MANFDYKKWVTENKYGKTKYRKKTKSRLNEQDPGLPWICMNLSETADAIDDGQSGLN